MVKALVEAGKVRTTHSARAGANELGFAFSDMLGVVMALTPADFYKSMTTHADHAVWHNQPLGNRLLVALVGWLVVRSRCVPPQHAGG